MIAEWNDGLAAVHGRWSSGLPLGDGPAAVRYAASCGPAPRWDVVHERFRHPVVRSFMTLAGLRHDPGPAASPAPACCRRRSRPAGCGSAGRRRSAGRAPCPPRWCGTWRRTAAASSPARRSPRSRSRDGAAPPGADRRRPHGHRPPRRRLRRPPGAAGGHARRRAGAGRPRPRPGRLAPRAQRLRRPRGAARPTSRSAPTAPTRSVAAGYGSAQGLVDQLDAFARGEADARDPWLLVVDQTVVDPGRAPDGAATFKILTVAPYERADGRSWADAKDEFAAAIVNLVGARAARPRRRRRPGAARGVAGRRRGAQPASTSAGRATAASSSATDGVACRGWASYATGVDGPVPHRRDQPPRRLGVRPPGPQRGPRGAGRAGPGRRRGDGPALRRVHELHDHRAGIGIPNPAVIMRIS